MPCSIAYVVYSQVSVCAHIAWPIHHSKGEKRREREPSPSASNLVSDPMGLQASGMHQGELKPSFFFCFAVRTLCEATYSIRAPC